MSGACGRGGDYLIVDFGARDWDKIGRVRLAGITKMKVHPGMLMKTMEAGFQVPSAGWVPWSGRHPLDVAAAGLSHPIGRRAVSKATRGWYRLGFGVIGQNVCCWISWEHVPATALSLKASGVHSPGEGQPNGNT